MANLSTFDMASEIAHKLVTIRITLQTCEASVGAAWAYERYLLLLEEAEKLGVAYSDSFYPNPPIGLESTDLVSLYRRVRQL